MKDSQRERKTEKKREIENKEEDRQTAVILKKERQANTRIRLILITS